MNEVEVLRFEIVKLREDMAKLMDLLTSQPAEEPKPTTLDEHIFDILISYQIPVHVKGFKYLKEAIKLDLEGNRDIGITKAIYPAIARTHNDTTSRVERAIRHAIEVAWDKGKHPYPKPSNSQFIALAAEKIRLEEIA